MEVTEHDGLKSVVVMNNPCAVDLDIHGVSCGFHQCTISLILYEDIRGPDIFCKTILSFNQANICRQVNKGQSIIL